MGAGKSRENDQIVEEDLSILTNFTSEELKQVHDDFMKKSPSGHMSKTEFDEFYASMFSNDRERRFMEHLFRTFDFNNDGRINFKEFVCGVSIMMRGSPEEKLTWTFNVYDVNKDGEIALEEMKEIMRAIYAINEISEAEQQKFGEKAFRMLDADGNGRVTVAEFIRGVKQDAQLIKMLENTTKIIT